MGSTCQDLRWPRSTQAGAPRAVRAGYAASVRGPRCRRSSRSPYASTRSHHEPRAQPVAWRWIVARGFSGILNREFVFQPGDQDIREAFSLPATILAADLLKIK